MANGPHGHFGRTGLRAVWRRADAAVPLLVKVVVPTVAIAVLAAAVVGTFLLRDTRRSVNEAYRAQSRVISHVVAGRYREGFDDPVVLNAFLEGLNRSAPLVVRIRLFRSTDGEPEVWADSGPEGAPLPDPAAARTTGAAFAEEGLIPVGTPTNPAWMGRPCGSAPCRRTRPGWGSRSTGGRCPRRWNGPGTKCWWCSPSGRSAPC